MVKCEPLCIVPEKVKVLSVGLANLDIFSQANPIPTCLTEHKQNCDVLPE